MHLHSYKIKNYRRLRDVRIELAPDISIFVGSNNSGKTSATQALHAFVSGSKERFSLYDFSSACWKAFDDLGELADGDAELPVVPSISLDLWFEVTASDLYLVIPLLPSTAWQGTQVGMRIVGVDVAERLADLQRFTQHLQAMMEPGSGATNGDVLRCVRDLGVIHLDPRVLSYLDLMVEAQADGQDHDSPGGDEGDGEELTKEISSMGAFLACPASQFRGYYKYVNNESPFSTQQGIKGAEFERVLVVLDDDEGTHVQFSYEKYLGIKPLSDRDETSRRNGKETTVERTRRLFYVCCTRALKDLIVVLFTSEIATAQRQITALGLFPAAAIHLEEELAQF